MSQPNSERLKRYREAARARGDCYLCRCRPVKPGTIHCQECLYRIRVSKKRLDAKRRAKRQCPGCGGKPARGRVTCEACRASVREMAARRRDRLKAEGKCIHCRLQAEPQKTYCAKCLASMVERNTARMKERVAEGKCRVAGCRRRMATGTSGGRGRPRDARRGEAP